MYCTRVSLELINIGSHLYICSPPNQHNDTAKEYGQSKGYRKSFTALHAITFPACSARFCCLESCKAFSDMPMLVRLQSNEAS